jgi:serine/threonine protein kinase/dienelactone hydrolase
MGVEAQTPYYAMEFVEGQTLAEFLRQLHEPHSRGAGDERVAHDSRTDWADRQGSQAEIRSPKIDADYCSQMVRAFIGVANGLQHAHEEGVVHRDIKPSNLMFDTGDRNKNDRRLRILDFGLARHESHDSLTLTGDILGTVAYMSPEQAAGSNEFDHRTDVYSLGATIYESLTLQPPFQGKTTQETLSQIASKEPASPSVQNPNVPRDLETIVLHCLRKDPRDRYPDAKSVANDLQSFLRGEPIKVRPQSTIERISRRTWRLRRPLSIGSLITVVVLALVFNAMSLYRANRDIVWVQQSIPRIKHAIASGHFVDAFELIRRAQQLAPEDATIRELSNPFIRRISVTSEPPGAKVSVREYGNPDGKWLDLGTTPIENIAAPSGEYRWQVDHPTCVHQHFTRFIYQYPSAIRRVESFDFVLTPKIAEKPGMLLLGGRSHAVSLGDRRRVQLTRFWMDQREVSNEDYQGFVDQGGYACRQYWQEPFTRDDSTSTLSFEEAIGHFSDQTGQPGPAGWRGGRYPEGRGKYPVTGVSWFEASAYARFRGKSLPTVYHWRGELGHEDAIANSMHNIGTEAVATVGEYPAIAPNGLQDMIGNVKEWCFNAEVDSNKRFALGGCWLDPAYAFLHLPSFSPWERNEEIGFRCAIYSEDQAFPALLAPVDTRPSPHPKPPPISPAELKTLKQSLYEYGEIDLRPEVTRLRESEEKIVEKITINAAYGNPSYDRLDLLLFLPKGFRRPLQVIINGHGNGAWSEEDLDMIQEKPYIVNSGRAYVFPATYGHFRNHGASVVDAQQGSLALTTERRVNQVLDVMRVVEYLQTRDDIDPSRIGYIGGSSGAKKTPMMLSVVESLRVGVMVAGGATRTGPDSGLPAGDPFNYAPDVRQPVLMLNGENDVIYPLENQKLIFRNLGSPIKRHSVFPGGHGFMSRLSQKNKFEQEILDWFDEHLGVPEREL